jgi:hypothetical protein
VILTDQDNDQLPAVASRSMITELLRDRHPVFSILGRSEARSFSTPAASGEWLSGDFHNGGGARTIPSERGNA